MRGIHFNYPARILVTAHTYVIICMAIKIQNVQQLLKETLCLLVIPFLLTSFPRQPLICFLLLWISFTYLGISGKMGPIIYSLLCVPAFVQCNDFENYPWFTCISCLFLFIAEWYCLNQQFAYSFT